MFLFLISTTLAKDSPLRTMDIFPLVDQHVHGATIVEVPNGDLLAAWFQGSGERWADDVAIMGSRLRAGDDKWADPFVLADVDGFPDINPVLFIDPAGRLWLMWYTVIANQWETSLPRYRISENYQKPGPPEWCWQDVLFVKPGDKTERGMLPTDKFVKSVERQLEEYGEYVLENAGDRKDQMTKLWKAWSEHLGAKVRGEDMMRKGFIIDEDGNRKDGLFGYPYFRRMGWQTKNKAVIIDDQRMIVPLYSDGLDMSLMAITDNCGKTWQFSTPLVGAGNIQASVAIKTDGTLVAYMRDNGPPPQRLHISESKDKGLTWSNVRDSILPNPGSGADVVTLKNGHWAIAYNDTEYGRYSLAVSISTDEGKTWPYKKHIEHDTREKNLATSSAYPSIIQGANGKIHVIYSYHHKDKNGKPNKTIKYAVFSEKWVTRP